MGWWIFRGIAAGGWFIWQWYTGGALEYTNTGAPPEYSLGGYGECTLTNAQCE